MMARYVIFPRFNNIHIERPEKYGGNVDYATYEELTADYFGGRLSPVDLKEGIVDGINKVLAPVADYFSKFPENYEKMSAIMASVKKLR